MNRVNFSSGLGLENMTATQSAPFKIEPDWLTRQFQSWKEYSEAFWPKQANMPSASRWIASRTFFAASVELSGIEAASHGWCPAGVGVRVSGSQFANDGSRALRAASSLVASVEVVPVNSESDLSLRISAEVDGLPEHAVLTISV
jgi:hypothetical protein